METNLEKLLKQKEEYLNSHPEMQDYQNQIDTIMEKCKPEDRFQVLQIMLANKLIELADKFTELKNIIQPK